MNKPWRNQPVNSKPLINQGIAHAQLQLLPADKYLILVVKDGTKDLQVIPNPNLQTFTIFRMLVTALHTLYGVMAKEFNYEESQIINPLAGAGQPLQKS